MDNAKKLDFNKLKTYSVQARRSKVEKGAFAHPLEPGATFSDFLGSLPHILKAADFQEIVSKIVAARKAGKPVMVLAGAHVIKCGLSPLLIDLMDRGIVTSVSLNGACVIHDFEIAYCGQTSEDVAAALEDGSFGMAKETADFINAAVKEGVARGLGFGSSVGEKISGAGLPNKELSLLCHCVEKKVPVTVHVAIGTDIIHQHPSFDAAATGEASGRDFQTMAALVAELGGGGVVLNIGSAVVLPEVFLKALSVARNLAGPVKDFTTVTMDMMYQYRPQQNIVSRPTMNSGKGYYIVGHHEIMVPLLCQAVKEKMLR